MRKILSVLAAFAMVFATACDPEEENQDKIPVNSVVLNLFELTLEQGQSETLVASVKPDNATDKTVTWSSSDEEVASVDSEGKVEAKKVGIAFITAKSGDKYDKCKIIVVEPTISGPVVESVDMGLSVKWASCNLGASQPEEYGDYYAWGEVYPYYWSLENHTWRDGKSAGYDLASYRWCNGVYNKITKYCYGADSQWDGEGNPDNKRVLDPEDDAAHVVLGGNWRMPTYEEWQELGSHCAWQFTTLNGVSGYKVTSKKSGFTDKWIFLPSAGFLDERSSTNVGQDGDYWSSTIMFYGNGSQFAMRIGWGEVLNISDTWEERYRGLSIRPVSD
jgi:hypothetical protein